MVSRGDSAAGLAMLGAVKGKLAYGDDLGHEAPLKQCGPQQQHDTTSHQRMCLLPAEIYEHVVDGGANQAMHQAMHQALGEGISVLGLLLRLLRAY